MFILSPGFNLKLVLLFILIMSFSFFWHSTQYNTGWIIFGEGKINLKPNSLRISLITKSWYLTLWDRVGRSFEVSNPKAGIEKVVNAKYIKTQKNEQVKMFYDKCLFRLTDSNESVRNYTLGVSEYKPKQINYIEVVNG